MNPKILLAASVLAGLSACSGKVSGGTDTARSPSVPSGSEPASRTTAAHPEAGTVPPGIAALGQHAENVYDMVKSGNWGAARASVDSLRTAVAAIPDVAPGTAHALDQAVASRDKLAALRESNRLTELGALLSQPYHPPVPAEVMLLDYQGRELEIWAAAADRAKLGQTAVAMRRTWTTVRPQVLARGGDSVAAHFDSLVTRVEAATTPGQYALLATPVLDAVDSLEGVFTR